MKLEDGDDHRKEAPGNNFEQDAANTKGVQEA
eukprot:CAMPEP_0113695274 /NCGR_PEP_ID=MMETSP0038_2-20120614/20809_1 /TAXON_ID=2898 /ORGANISM="Cryptomonas paramecium" /LENGTH=31 /DNA_ID=CAMNT_0000617799 /DNA_START=10 /DNA_END=106 /DNA_ORIENTATION=+ /assembly_acc=CAM_ASM_000170